MDPFRDLLVCVPEPNQYSIEVFLSSILSVTLIEKTNGSPVVPELGVESFPKIGGSLSVIFIE